MSYEIVAQTVKLNNNNNNDHYILVMSEFLTLKRFASEGSSSPHSVWVSSMREMSEVFFIGL